MPMFPMDFTVQDDNGNAQRDIFSGLTKREYFAGLAMQGMIREDVERVDCKDDIAAHSIRYADALLKALENA